MAQRQGHLGSVGAPARRPWHPESAWPIDAVHPTARRGWRRVSRTLTLVSQHSGPEREAAQLREDLELSRRELADARIRLEAALEEAATERRLREEAEARSSEPAHTAPVSHGRPAKRGRLTERLRRQAQ